MKKFKEYLTEAKLSRVFNYFNNTDYPVGVITTFRKDKPIKDGIKDNQKLAKQLRELGYGYVWVDGAWKETDPDTGEKVDVKEDSIFVIGSADDNNKLYDILLQKTKEYDQDGFLFKPEGTTEVFIVDKNGEEEKIADASKDFKSDKFEYGYTILRGGGAGRVFSLHETRVDPNWVGVRLKHERDK